jgi:dUTP pyrophosphatase
MPTIYYEAVDERVEIPQRQTPGSAGIDLSAYLPDGALSLAPGQRALVRSGLRLRLPAGWCLDVRPRSGRAMKEGLTVLNAPGTIDADYRDEVGVILVNLGQEPVRVEHGERIAQLVATPVFTTRMVPGDVPMDTERAGGFGSTGV